MSFGHRKSHNRVSQGNPIMRFARGVNHLIEGYQEVRAEALRRYPDMFL